MIKYKDCEIDIALCNYIEGVTTIPLPDGSIVCIPEEGATEEEIEIINQIKADIEARVPVVDIEALKQAKIQSIKLECANKIYNGFDSIVKYGELKHYTLKDYEQSNMQALLINIMSGATTVPWRHSDLIVCDTWTAQEFMELYQQAMAFTVNQRYKSDVVELYLTQEILTADEIGAVNLEMSLPQIYQDILIEKLTQAGVPLWV